MLDQVALATLVRAHYKDRRSTAAVVVVIGIIALGVAAAAALRFRISEDTALILGPAGLGVLLVGLGAWMRRSVSVIEKTPLYRELAVNHDRVVWVYRTVFSSRATPLLMVYTDDKRILMVSTAGLGESETILEASRAFPRASLGYSEEKDRAYAHDPSALQQRPLMA